MQKSLAVDPAQTERIQKYNAQQKINEVVTEARKILRNFSGVIQARKLTLRDSAYIILECERIVLKEYNVLLNRLQTEDPARFQRERNFAHSHAALKAIEDREANPHSLLNQLRNGVPKGTPWSQILKIVMVPPNWKETNDLHILGFSDEEIVTLQQQALGQNPTKI